LTESIESSYSSLVELRSFWVHFEYILNTFWVLLRPITLSTLHHFTI